MAEPHPIAEQLSSPSDPPLTGLAWYDVRKRLADSEGTAYRVRERATLQRISDLFPVKYPWWHPLVHDGAFHDPADTSLSNPQHVFAVEPAVVFAFGKQKGFTATRWRF